MKYKRICGIINDKEKFNKYKKEIQIELISFHHLTKEEAEIKMKKYKKQLIYYYNANYNCYDTSNYIVWNYKAYKNFSQYKKLLKKTLIEKQNYTKQELKIDMKLYSNDDLYYYYSRNLHYSTLACGIALGYL